MMFYNFTPPRIFEEKAYFLLKVSLALVFIYFGLLKIAGLSPVGYVVAPISIFMSEGPGFFMLGLFEVIVGLAIFFKRFSAVASLLMVFHLIGTLGLFFFDWSMMFSPVFPALSLEGEFVFKNIILIAVAFYIWVHERRRTFQVK